MFVLHFIVYFEGKIKQWYLFHDLLLRSYLCHCVWSVTTAHNLTPEKRDDNYSPYPLTPTSCLRYKIRLTVYNCHLSLLWVTVICA